MLCNNEDVKKYIYFNNNISCNYDMTDTDFNNLKLNCSQNIIKFVKQLKKYNTIKEFINHIEQQINTNHINNINNLFINYNIIHALPSNVDGVQLANVQLCPSSLIPLSHVPVPPVPIASVPVASVPVASVPVASVPVASVPVASVPVASVPVASVPVASVPVASVPVASVSVASIPVASVNVPPVPIVSVPIVPITNRIFFSNTIESTIIHTYNCSNDSWICPYQYCDLSNNINNIKNLLILEESELNLISILVRDTLSIYQKINNYRTLINYIIINL